MSYVRVTGSRLSPVLRGTGTEEPMGTADGRGTDKDWGYNDKLRGRNKGEVGYLIRQGLVVALSNLIRYKDCCI